MTDLDRNLLSEQKTPLYERVISAVINAALVIVLIVIALSCAFEPVLISGTSMMDTIRDGETVLIYNGYSSPERGDIVVIDTGEVNIIKRIVAIGGDRVGFVREDEHIVLYLDEGSGFCKADEPYIKEDMLFSPAIFSNLSVASSLDELIEDELFVTVNADCVIALGDNRNVSKDSRHYGQFNFKSVMGKSVRVFSKDDDGFLKKLIEFIYSDATPVNNN